MLILIHLVNMNQAQLPSSSEVAGTDEIELEEIAKKMKKIDDETPLILVPFYAEIIHIELA